jgi:hypothetical protein
VTNETTKHHGGNLMIKTKPVRSIIRDYLENKRPLTHVTLEDLYSQVLPEQSNSVRAALYGLSVGTPVSQRNRPSKYYAIRLKLDGKEVFFSLPGVSNQELMTDQISQKNTDQIINRLRTKYGKETIDYWGKAAQKRSVDQAASGMRKAKKRDDKACQLCTILGKSTQQPVSACHIVSRKTVFWAVLDEIDKFKGNIFSDDAVLSLKVKLKNNNIHSNSQYILTLCSEHDKIVQDALNVSMNGQRSSNVNKLPDCGQLWDNP